MHEALRWLKARAECVDRPDVTKSKERLQQISHKNVGFARKISPRCRSDPYLSCNKSDLHMAAGSAVVKARERARQSMNTA